MVRNSDDTVIDVVQFSRRAYPGAYSIERVFRDISRGMPADIALRRVVNVEFSQGVLPRLRDALRARRQRGQVNHVVGDVHYLTFFLLRRRTILTIHDCEMVHRARGFRRFFYWLLWLRMPVWRSGTIVAISEQTRCDLEALLSGAKGRIEVIENPVSPEFVAMPPPSQASLPVVLHIGTKANKNLERLVEAARGLEVKLLIIGPMSPTQIERLLESGLQFENRQSLSSSELVAAYGAANLVSFVSLSEGFGLPILEAQATGRPVLCSDREPMRSVAGTGALLVDPEDTEAIRAGLKQLLKDDELQAKLIAAGFDNVARFSVHGVASKYAELYRRVAKQ